MPISLVSIVLGWLTSHLVLFSLTGFVLAGLLVFGVIELGPVRQAPPVATHSMQVPADNVVTRGPGSAPEQPELKNPASVAVPHKPAATRAGAVAVQAPEPAYKAPRLIGGSLPLYEGSRLAHLGVTPGTDEVDRSFRPASDEARSDPSARPRDDLVQQARRAFWNGDFEAAEAAYMILISAYPADADAFGELGNLYRSMGKPTQALDAYFEAGVRLKAAGEGKKLLEVIDILQADGDLRADQLRP